MAANVWMGNDRWPSGRNLGEFAQDVFRLENCKTVTPLGGGLQGKFRIRNGLAERKAGKTSVQYARNIMLRVDMHSHHSDASPLLQSLRITAGYQQNMFTQPMLTPGRNRIWLEGRDMGGAKLTAEWNYTLQGCEQAADVSLAEDGKAEKTVALDVERQEDIIMRGVSVRCE